MRNKLDLKISLVLRSVLNNSSVVKKEVRLWVTKENELL